MYELRCPFCGHQVRSPFVRVSAATVCPKCGKAYQIESAHVLRRLPPAQGGASDPLLGSADAQSAQATAHAAESGVGLSGLSELMRREAAAQAAKAPFATAAPPPTTTTAATASRRLQYSLARFATTQRRLCLLASAGALALAVLLLAVWYSRGSDALGDGRIDPALTIVPGELLQAESWKPIGQPFDPPMKIASAVRVEDAAIVSGEGSRAQVRVSASVVTHPNLVVADAELTLSLVNEAGTEVARTRVPIVLINYENRRLITVPIPRDIDEPNLRVVPSIKVKDTMADAIYFSETAVTALAGDPRILLHIAGRNPLDRPVNRLVLLVTAYDEDDQVVGRWRVHWSEPVAPDAELQFYAAVAVDDSVNVLRWTVEAGGR